MPYIPYADREYYQKTYHGTLIPEEEQEKALAAASRHIDTLTYNRIVGKGINKLTEFQQDIIRECVCRQAEFETENKDIIGSLLQSYSINGVSMSFGTSWNMEVQNGIAIQKDNYNLLCQTGLCSRRL